MWDETLGGVLVWGLCQSWFLVVNKQQTSNFRNWPDVLSQAKGNELQPRREILRTLGLFAPQCPTALIFPPWWNSSFETLKVLKLVLITENEPTSPASVTFNVQSHRKWCSFPRTSSFPVFTFACSRWTLLLIWVVYAHIQTEVCPLFIMKPPVPSHPRVVGWSK